MRRLAVTLLYMVGGALMGAIIGDICIFRPYTSEFFTVGAVILGLVGGFMCARMGWNSGRED